MSSTTKRNTFRCAKPKIDSGRRRSSKNQTRRSSKTVVDAQTQKNDDEITDEQTGTQRVQSTENSNTIEDDEKSDLLSRNELPRFLYAKKGRGISDTFAGLSGKTKPVVVYAVRAKTSDYRFRLKLDWKPDSKVFDETRRYNHITFGKAATMYDGLVRMIGIKKNREVWRIFNIYLVSSVLDTRTKRELLDGVRNHYQDDEDSEVNSKGNVTRYDSRSHSVEMDIDALSYSEQLAHELYHHFGHEHYDWQSDFIDVAAVSRRSQDNARALVRKMSETFHECTLFRQSGCWLSPRLTTYRTVATWKYDGLRTRDLFSHGGDGMERHVVRHHPTRCELFIQKDHCRCCRPSHLCYGSAMANTRDMQLRQAVGNLLILFSKLDSRLKLVEIADVFSGLLQNLDVGL